MDDKYWTTKEGEKVLIREMSNSHLANTIAMLKRKGSDIIRRGGGDDSGDFWYDEEPRPIYMALVNELKARGV
jgi:hypothetical protein